jgi:hypothetical protein
MELLGESLEACRELGMVALEKKISSQGEAPAGPTTLDTNVFRREGEYWSIAYEGKLLRLKDAKGLHYLARIIREPGREFHALELAADGEGVLPLGDAGAVLDPKAKAAYRRRLAELEEELDEASSWADRGREAGAREEKDALVRELAAAVGLGGRDRLAASASERARVNVTRAVKAILAKLREHHPVLGRHLASTIRTGTFCSYAPDPRFPMSWET